MRNEVHWRISTLATVKSVTAATRTVVIRSSRRYPPESSSRTAASVVNARPEVFLVAREVWPPRRDQLPRGIGHHLRRSREGHVSRLAHGALHRGDLRLRRQHHDQPEPAQPRGARTRARERVERRQRRLAVRDRVSAQLDLHEDLDHAGQQDQPEQAEARLGAQARGVDQLARPHDRGGQDQPRADLPDRPEDRVRRLSDRIGRQRVKVVVVLVIRMAVAFRFVHDRSAVAGRVLIQSRDFDCGSSVGLARSPGRGTQQPFGLQSGLVWGHEHHGRLRMRVSRIAARGRAARRLDATSSPAPANAVDRRRNLPSRGSSRQPEGATHVPVLSILVNTRLDLLPVSHPWPSLEWTDCLAPRPREPVSYQRGGLLRGRSPHGRTPEVV